MCESTTTTTTVVCFAQDEYFEDAHVLFGRETAEKLESFLLGKKRLVGNDRVFTFAFVFVFD